MLLIRSACLLAVLALTASASDISGTWKAWFTGPVAERPKTVSEMTFELKVDGQNVTGQAHMPNWPGDADITKGKITDDRLSFTVIGKSPWKSRWSGGESSGYPKLDFEWRFNKNEAELKLTWGNVMIHGEDSTPPRVMQMQAKKLKDSE